MENAADALKLAAWVLIFVLALSIAMNAFSTTRLAATTILDYNDREYDYSYVEENVDDSGNVITQRIVGLETIVPTIYKAYKENYKIIFEDGIFADGVYQREDETGTLVIVNSIDLQNEVLGSETQKEQFIMAVLYGTKYDNFTDVKNTFRENMGISLNETGIYDKINSRRLKESIGIYYQEEISENGEPSDPDNEESSVPEANKTEKRVITYSNI